MYTLFANKIHQNQLQYTHTNVCIYFELFFRPFFLFGLIRRSLAVLHFQIFFRKGEIHTHNFPHVTSHCLTAPFHDILYFHFNNFPFLIFLLSPPTLSLSVFLFFYRTFFHFSLFLFQFQFEMRRPNIIR